MWLQDWFECAKFGEVDVCGLFIFESPQTPHPLNSSQPHIAYYVNGLIIFCSYYIVSPAINKL